MSPPLRKGRENAKVLDLAMIVLSTA